MDRIAQRPSHSRQTGGGRPQARGGGAPAKEEAAARRKEAERRDREQRLVHERRAREKEEQARREAKLEKQRLLREHEEKERRLAREREEQRQKDELEKERKALVEQKVSVSKQPQSANSKAVTAAVNENQGRGSKEIAADQHSQKTDSLLSDLKTTRLAKRESSKRSRADSKAADYGPLSEFLFPAVEQGLRVGPWLQEEIDYEKLVKKAFKKGWLSGCPSGTKIHEFLARKLKRDPELIAKRFEAVRSRLEKKPKEKEEETFRPYINWEDIVGRESKEKTGSAPDPKFFEELAGAEAAVEASILPVSPIFALLRRKETVSMARSLLGFESRCATLKKEHGEITRQLKIAESKLHSTIKKEFEFKGKVPDVFERIKGQTRNAINAANSIKDTTFEKVKERIDVLKTMPTVREIENELGELDRKCGIIEDADRLQASALKASIDKLNKDFSVRERELDARIADLQWKLHNDHKEEYMPKEQLQELLVDLVDERHNLDAARHMRIKALNRHASLAQEAAAKLNLSDKDIAEMKRRRHFLRSLPLTRSKHADEMKKLKDNQDKFQTAHELAASESERLNSAKIEVELERTRIKKSLDDAKDSLNSIESELAKKEQDIEKVRELMRQKFGRVDDGRFDINASRDERNHTFLMVSVQNNDVTTAKLCLQLGASVDKTCYGGRTAMFFAGYFGFDQLVSLLSDHGCRQTGDRTWDVFNATKTRALHPIDWETQLRIAENAAVPADTQLSAVEETLTGTTLEGDARFEAPGCFDGCLFDPGNCVFQRVALIERHAYDWIIGADIELKKAVIRFIRKLRNGKKSVFCHRHFYSGVKREKQFEVFCVELSDVADAENAAVAKDANVVFFSPFVESYIAGKAKVGILIWAISTEREATKLETLIKCAEFRRYKVDYPDDHYPPHRDDVLELGKDMHLLDLKGTSIFTMKPMELLLIGVDSGDLNRIGDEFFQPEKRLLDYEMQIRDAIFGSSASEAQQINSLVNETQQSTYIGGGAGTGKCLDHHYFIPNLYLPTLIRIVYCRLYRENCDFDKKDCKRKCSQEDSCCLSSLQTDFLCEISSCRRARHHKR